MASCCRSSGVAGQADRRALLNQLVGPATQQVQSCRRKEQCCRDACDTAKSGLGVGLRAAAVLRRMILIRSINLEGSGFFAFRQGKRMTTDKDEGSDD